MAVTSFFLVLVSSIRVGVTWVDAIVSLLSILFYTGRHAGSNPLRFFSLRADTLCILPDMESQVNLHSISDQSAHGLLLTIILVQELIINSFQL